MYRIIYKNTFYGDEEIDEVETRYEAIKMVREYKTAFKSNNIYFQRI
jgi:hypothetical protein